MVFLSPLMIPSTTISFLVFWVLSARLLLMLNLIPVGRLIIAADQATTVVSSPSLITLRYGVRAMRRYTVVGEKGVEDWAQHTPQWYPSV